MSDLNKRIALELLTAPATVLPVTVGVSLLMLSVIIGSAWGFFGFCLCLLGVGALLHNLSFNLGAISKRALDQIHRQKQTERNQKLDELHAKLSRNREPRDHVILRNMRTVYDEFMEDLRAGRIGAFGVGKMVEQIEEIFNECVANLERQHQIGQMTRKVSGDLKEGFIKQREELLNEVERSVRTMADVINEVRALGLKASKGELTALSERLTRQLEVAKATERELVNLDTDLSRFREYQ